MKKIVVTLLVFLMILSFAYADGYTDKTVRVGLVQWKNSENSVPVVFDGSHYVLSGANILGIVDYKTAYTVQIFDRQVFLSSAIKASLSDWDSTLILKYIPLYTREGVRLLSINEPEDDAELFQATRVRGASFNSGGNLKFVVNNSRITIRSVDYSAFTVGKYKYRGAFSAYVTDSNALWPVNELSLEKYLLGVVPNEMPASWEAEALKVQAVCARTYAYNKLLMKSPNFDLTSATGDQMYKGYSSEQASSNTAVQETKGLIITYAGKPISSFFSASNGGHTASSKEVWNLDKPYLIAKPDPYDAKANITWSITFTKSELEKIVSNNNGNIGEIKGVKILSRTPNSKRVGDFSIVGEKGEKVFTGSQIRKNFGYNKVKSLLFDYDEKPTGSNSVPDKLSVITSGGVKNLDKSNLFVLTSFGKQPLEVTDKKITASGISDVVAAGSGLDAAEGNFDSVFSIKGKGYGHGIGMSQHGANQMAKEGFYFDEILKFYYHGTNLNTL